MSGSRTIIWTISGGTLPRPLLNCSRCDARRPFESSGRFRLNANGKRLDAWLVYRCAVCGASWNRTIFERTPRSALDAATLDALHANDPALAAAIAADAAGLRRWTDRIEAARDCSIEPNLPGARSGDDDATRLSIRIAVAATVQAPRADRMIAAGLGISRTRVEAMLGEGRVGLSAQGRRGLRRPVADGALLTVDLAGLRDAPAIAAFAAGLDRNLPRACAEDDG